MTRTVVTSYRNPDTDGVACAIAYCELNQTQQDLEFYFFGKINGETKSLLEFLKIDLHLSETYPIGSKVVLVDTHHIRQVPKEVELECVIEIIDHHPNGDPDCFPNARILNEPVGAAASLVAELFLGRGISPSASIAGLLLGAILSNTLGFQSSSTSDRDIKMAEWLKTFGHDEKKFIHVMQEGMRKAFFEDLSEQLFSDLKQFQFEDTEIVIGQIELPHLFRDVSFDEISQLFAKRLKSNRPVHIMNCVDTALGKSKILFATEQLFERVTPQLNDALVRELTVHTDRVLQRKTDILPYL